METLPALECVEGSIVPISLGKFLAITAIAENSSFHDHDGAPDIIRRTLQDGVTEVCSAISTWPASLPATPGFPPGDTPPVGSGRADVVAVVRGKIAFLPWYNTA
jgi:hypothetical protein